VTIRTWLQHIPRAFPLGLVTGLCCLAPALASAASVWTAAQVDNTGAVGKFASLALDSNKKMHVSYFDTAGSLRYATDKSGAFAVSTLASDVVSAGTAIAVDPSNNPQIVYFHNNGGGSKGIRHIAYNGTGWGAASDPNGTFSPDPDVSASLFNKGGISHLVYSRPGYLSYGFNTTADNYAVWDRTSIDSTGNSGANNSIVVNAAGKVHVVGYNSSSTDLFYYTNESGLWVKSTLATSTDIVGKGCTLAIDASGNLHLSYLETTATPASYKIKYRFKSAVVGSAWQSAVDVADAGSLGGHSSIAVDATGAAHISYYYSNAASTGKLGYATNLGGSWQTEDVDTASSDLGNYSSIALDGDQTVYIAYYDAANTALKTATKRTLAVTPLASNFGTVDRGFQSSPDSTITITNNLLTGQSIGSISTGGANPSEFAVTSDSCSNLQLSAGSSCSVQLHFAPPAGAPRSSARSATLTIPATAPYSSTLDLALSAATSASYLLTAGAGNGGSVTPVKVAVAPGGSQTFTVLPDQGFSVAEVTADGITPLTAPYTLSDVTADHSVFVSLVSPIRILQSFIYYGSLQSAYAAVNNDWTIQSQESIPAGDLQVDRDLYVTLSGGYDSSFAAQPGQTGMPGNITISNGTLAVENLLLQ